MITDRALGECEREHDVPLHACDTIDTSDTRSKY